MTGERGGAGWRDRAFHRLTYREGDRPPLRLADGARGAVVDCSETGIRYRPDPRDPLPSYGMLVEALPEKARAKKLEILGEALVGARAEKSPEFRAVCVARLLTLSESISVPVTSAVLVTA